MASKGSVLVIGSGAAGTAAARGLAASEWDVTVVERSKVGGTCLWHGCMPKKSLYAGARAVREAVRSERFGLPGGCCADWQSVLAWKWHAQETYAGDQAAGFASRGITLVEGDAAFVSPDTVAIGNRELHPDHVVLATGAHAVRPPIPGAELADVSDDALGYPEVPESLVIIGGGFIAFEFAAIYASFGSAVTLVVRSATPLEMLDPDIAEVAVRRLANMGAKILTSTHTEGIEGNGTSLRVMTRSSGGASAVIEGERVLLATGRAPSLEGLGLNEAGIERDGRGRLVLDAALRTTNPRVWAVGDAAGGDMHTPLAALEGRTVAASIDSGAPRGPDLSAVPTCCFTTPQLAQVGLTEAEAIKAGHAVRIATQPLEYLGAAIVDEERDGLVKLVLEAETGRVLGAHIAAPTASDLIYALAVAVHGNMTAVDLASVIGIHPAYCEAVNWAAFG